MNYFNVLRENISTVLQVAALVAIVQTVILTTPSVDTGSERLVTNFKDADRAELLYYSAPAALV